MEPVVHEAQPADHRLIDAYYNRLVELGERGYGIVCLNPFDYMTVRKIGRDRMHVTGINQKDGFAAQLMGQIIPPGEYQEATSGGFDDRKGPVCSGVWVTQNQNVPAGWVRVAARLGDAWDVVRL